MTLLEIIAIRTTRKNQQELESFLTRWQSEVKAEGKTTSVKIYKQAELETDYSVHLRYDPDTREKEYRVLGERLASNLKEFGLINHTFWVEKEFKKYNNKRKQP